ncbi:MAG: hypothetical protein R3A80_12795 [Bdellovibrionota bacterium]
MKKNQNKGTINKFGKLALAALCAVLPFALQAKQMSCFTEEGNGRGATSIKCSMDVSINENTGVAVGTWNGQIDSTELDRDDDNLAEFVFNSGTEAGIWEHENSDGTKEWAGFILPGDEDGFCRVKCVNR